MPETMRSVEAAVEILRDRGVRYAFGVPGESFLGLLDALHDIPEIDLVSSRHEGGAAFMADAAAKLTGQPAICMGTRGVGSANLAIGIHTAQQDSTPMIAMVGQVETPFRHMEALQEVELASFLSPITKWSIEATAGSELPRLTSEAYRIATSGRPGPVAIALRGDILDETVEFSGLPPSARAIAHPAPEQLAEILELLAASERPLIIAGGGILRSGAVQLLQEFAEATETPVATAFRRLDAFPTDHPLSLGSLSFGTPAPVRKRAQDADLVLAIGTRLSELTTLGFTVPGKHARLVHIDVEPSVLGRSFAATVAMLSDARRCLAALIDMAAMMTWPDRNDQNSRDRKAFEDAIRAGSGSVTSLVDPALVVQAMARRLPDDAVITADAGNFFGWVQRFGSFRQPGTFLGPTSGAMGYAVPAAVAATIVHRGTRKVVATAGDGGFFMTGNELAVAAQRGLPVICVVFNNSLYGTIRLHQEKEYPGRVSGTELWTPDIVKYAEAFGGLGIRIDSNADVDDAVRKAIEHPGIVVIDVAVDRNTIAPGVRLDEVSG